MIQSQINVCVDAPQSDLQINFLKHSTGLKTLPAAPVALCSAGVKVNKLKDATKVIYIR